LFQMLEQTKEKFNGGGGCLPEFLQMMEFPSN
jgi:hypothetical protein